MKKGWKMAVVVMAAAVIGWFGIGKGEVGIVKAETAAASGSQTALNTITVGATGSVMVDPDIAYVNAAVETRGATAGEAQQDNANKFAAIEKVLYEKFGLSKKDVQTTGFYVQPEYNYMEKEGRKLIGYTAVHSVKVSYRKLDEIGKLLDAMSAAGANRMDGVQFSTEKADQYELEALKKAMANADAKANVLAASAKRQVKGVVNIVQGAASAPPVMYAAMEKSMAADSASAPTSVQAGQIEISTSVTVQYQM
ncbi:SIMPL domain-containing protein [Cohnella sp. CFH 77786]|uniref:SIMPL domain-containing protein n=1 Tax=Cohnella sp. CFH 77786 TaxID=2662265 RepID=UPI0021035598|nr:SIMPL domain-containing protein [Cohnella sp. CFH 77786]